MMRRERLEPYHDDGFPYAAEMDAFWQWLHDQSWAQPELERAWDEYWEGKEKPTAPEDMENIDIVFFEWFHLDRPLEAEAGKAAGRTPLAAWLGDRPSPLTETRHGIFLVKAAAGARYELQKLDDGSAYTLEGDEDELHVGELTATRLYPAGEVWIAPFINVGMIPASEGWTVAELEDFAAMTHPIALSHFRHPLGE